MGAVAALCAVAACVAGALLAIAAYLWASRPRTTVPGPPALPLIGNLLHFWKLPIVFQYFKDLQSVYGNVFRFYLATELVVVVTQAEDAQKLLAGCRLRDRGPYLTAPLRTFTGNGLVTSKGEAWKAKRRMVELCFHSEVLKRFSAAYNEGAQFICDSLREARGSQVRLYQTLCLASLRTLAASAFGLPFEEMVPDPVLQDNIADAFLGALQIIQKRIFRPWLQLECVIHVTGLQKAVVSHYSVLNNLVSNGIAYKKMNRGSPSDNKRKALMDALMESKEQITDEEIRDEILTFAAAGTETTACAMGFALVLLSLHPEWQDAAQKELDIVFGSGDEYLRHATPEDLAQLPVIESIIKETLRLYPAVPTAPVHLEEDTPLAGGRFVAPRGTHVLVALFLLHRQPDVFPDPEKFDPSRFLESKGSTRQPSEYLPFGAGSRKCVGDRFAMFAMKTALAAVLRQFRVLPGSTRKQLDEVAVSITSVPVNDFEVTCVPRTNLPM